MNTLDVSKKDCQMIEIPWVFRGSTDHAVVRSGDLLRSLVAYFSGICRNFGEVDLLSTSVSASILIPPLSTSAPSWLSGGQKGGSGIDISFGEDAAVATGFIFFFLLRLAIRPSWQDMQKIPCEVRA
jgi:hypothetical protein